MYSKCNIFNALEYVCHKILPLKDITITYLTIDILKNLFKKIYNKYKNWKYKTWTKIENNKLLQK